MPFDQIIIIILFLTLLQDVIFETFTYDCAFFKYKNIRNNLPKIFIITQSITLPYIFLSNILFYYLKQNNMVILSILLFCFLFTICLQISEILFKKASFIIELNPKVFAYSAILACIQISFISILILYNDTIYSEIIISLFTILAYCILSFIFSYLIPEIENQNIPEFARGLPIKIFTISILLFVIIGVF